MESATPPDRLPPQDLGAEQSVLGSIVRDNGVAEEVFAIVQETMFYTDAHRRIYQAVRALVAKGSPVDLVTLADQLHAQKDVERIGGYGYLAQVLDATPAAANAVYYAKIVRDKWVLRELMHAGTEIIRNALNPSGPAQEVAAWAADRLSGIEAHDGEDFQHISVILEQTAEYIDQVHTQGSDGIPYGVADLDRLTAGMHPEEVILVAARPSVGKSQFGLQVARNAAKLGHGVAFVSLEMSKHRQVAVRMVCADNQTNPNKFRQGLASDYELRLFQQTAREASQWNLFVVDNPEMTCDRILAGARKIQRQRGLGLLCIDYLQLVTPSRRFERKQLEIADISRRLKMMGKQLNIPLLVMCQLNRGPENRPDGEPHLADLREAGELEQDADTVLLLWRDANNKDILNIKLGKQRDGPVGVVKVINRPDIQRFENYGGTAP